MNKEKTEAHRQAEERAVRRRERRWLQALLDFIKYRFDLSSDSAQQKEVIENISKGVEFRGTNLWILIFATLIASLGLNINSPPVIIGAMLISPLMGPIMGIGLSLGINDFELLKRSVRNIGFMVLVTMVASTLYFLVSPISIAQSELLARTNPTTYDVLIALFGGLAGMIAQTRKDRTSMVIPGVAIATTLLPPLCTAGYGIATGQWNFLIGATYLFVINIIFIAFATYFVATLLHYDKKVFLDKTREAKVKRMMAVILTATLVPSVILAVNIINRTAFEDNADKYVKNVFKFNQTMVLNYDKTFRDRDGQSVITISLVGEPISDETIEEFTVRLADFNLGKARLVVNQVKDNEENKLDFSTLNLNYAALLDEKNHRIADMESQLSALVRDTVPVHSIVADVGFVVDNVASISLSRQMEYAVGKNEPAGTVLVCVVTPQDRKKPVDKKKLSAWLTIKTGDKNIKIYVE